MCEVHASFFHWQLFSVQFLFVEFVVLFLPDFVTGFGRRWVGGRKAAMFNVLQCLLPVFVLPALTLHVAF